MSIDFEPSTDVHNVSNNPTPRDGLNYADFIGNVADALHAADKTLSVATQAVSSACMSSPCRLVAPGQKPDCAHTWNLKPCPWIRSFFSHDALARTSVDSFVPMDTYTLNTTEAPYDVWYMQKYHSIDK